MVDIVKDIGGGLVNRRRARAGHRVGRRPGVDRAGLEAVGHVVRGRGPVLAVPGDRWLRRPVADDAAVDPAPREFAAQPAELDLRAAVHDDFDPSPFRRSRCRVVADAELHPHDLRADCDCVVDDCRRVSCRTENIDHVDRLGDVAQRCVGCFAEQHLSGDAGVYRDHPVAFALQVFHHEIARPVPVRRGADHGDGLDALQDRAELRVRVRDRVQAAHGCLTVARLPESHRCAAVDCGTGEPFTSSGRYSKCIVS